MLDALLGAEGEIPVAVKYAIEGMEILAEALTNVPGSQTRTVARALARKVVKIGVKVDIEDVQLPVEALSDALSWLMGVDNCQFSPDMDPSIFAQSSRVHVQMYPFLAGLPYPGRIRGTVAKGAGTGPRIELKIAQKVSNLRGSLQIPIM